MKAHSTFRFVSALSRYYHDRFSLDMAFLREEWPLLFVFTTCICALPWVIGRAR